MGNRRPLRGRPSPHRPHIPRTTAPARGPVDNLVNIYFCYTLTKYPVTFVTLHTVTRSTHTHAMDHTLFLLTVTASFAYLLAAGYFETFRTRK